MVAVVTSPWSLQSALSKSWVKILFLDKGEGTEEEKERNFNGW